MLVQIWIELNWIEFNTFKRRRLQINQRRTKKFWTFQHVKDTLLTNNYDVISVTKYQFLWNLDIPGIVLWSSARSVFSTQYVCLNSINIFRSMRCAIGITNTMPFRLSADPRLRMSSNDLTSSSSVRVLGVIIDSGLTLVTHVSIVARNCFYQLRRIRQAKKNLDEGSVKTLIQALVLSRLDYCNSILSNLPDVTLAPLVRVQHSAAKVDSESEKAGSSIATHDGAPLVTASLQNNIQVVRADAWRPLRYRAEIHEGVGHA